jgi:hypothetical protein
MRKLLIGLLIFGGVIAAIAVIRRRSGSGDDGWDSFAADDVYAQASKADTKATDAAKDAATTATRAAKDTAVKATDAAVRATDAAKDAAAKANEAAKDA